MTTTDLTMSNLPYEVELVADWLVMGKPELGWKGDPRLSLCVGVITMHKAGPDRRGTYRRKGEVVARNLQVFRHNEDGTDTNILSRKLDAWHDIIPSLVQLDPRNPGHVDTMTKVEKANAIVDKANSTAVAEAHGEAAEHLWKLVADREHGKTTFRQMPGSNPDKQQ